MGSCCSAFCAEFSKQRLGYRDFNKGEWVTVFGSSSNRWCLKHRCCYAVFELLQALAITAILAWSVYVEFGEPGHCGTKYFIFLTYWAVIMQVAYAWCSWWTTRTANAMRDGDLPLRQQMPIHAVLTWVLQDLLLPLTFLSGALYWTLVAPKQSEPPELISYMTHGANFGLVVLDVFFSRRPHYLLHGLYFLIFQAIYLMFTYVYFARDGTDCVGNPYIYAAVDWREPTSVARLSGFITLVATPALNLALWLLISRCFPSRRDGPARVSESESEDVPEAKSGSSTCPHIAPA
jgi:hypothetical protein